MPQDQEVVGSTPLAAMIIWKLNILRLLGVNLPIQLALLGAFKSTTFMVFTTLVKLRLLISPYRSGVMLRQSSTVRQCYRAKGTKLSN